MWGLAVVTDPSIAYRLTVYRPRRGISLSVVNAAATLLSFIANAASVIRSFALPSKSINI